MILGLWEKIIVLIIVTFGGYLIAAALRKGPTKRENQFFALFSTSLLLWIVSAFFSEVFKEPGAQIFFSRLTFLGVLLSHYFIFYFSINFPKRRILPKLISFLLTTIAVVFFALDVFSGSIISGISQTQWGFDLVFGSAYYFLIGFCIMLELWTFVEFLTSLRGASKVERSQLKYIFWGVGIFFGITILVNVIIRALVGSDIYYRFGNYSGIFLVVFSAVAVIQHHLFDIKLIIAEILVAILEIILLILPFSMPTTALRVLTVIIFLLFTFFSFYLLKAIENEGKRSEEAEFTAMRERAMRREAEELANNLKNLNQAKSQFLLSTQHHLRSPLTVVQGYLSLISEGTYGKIPNIVKAKIDVSLDTTQKLINLVNEMLDVAHFQMNKGSVDKQSTDIAELVSGIIDDLEPNAQAKKIYLHFNKLAEKFPLVAVDSRGIREAIYNITDNAIKYTREGGVTVLLAVVGEKLRLSVVDTGIGMNDFDRRNLFNRTFERGARAKEVNVTGKGIGLYLAGQMIINNNGTIHVGSAGRGKGSTFIIELPVIETVLTNPATEAVPKPPARP